TALERGRFQTVRDGGDVTIVAAGSTVSRALAAAELLAADGIQARVLNAVYVAPLDVDAIRSAAVETRAIVTAEEANVAGGIGAAVASAVAATESRVPVEVLGFREFAPTGSAGFLLDYAGLSATGIRDAALRALSR